MNRLEKESQLRESREYIPLDDLAPKSFRERYLVSVDILKIVVESLHRYTSIPDIFIFF